MDYTRTDDVVTLTLSTAEVKDAGDDFDSGLQTIIANWINGYRGGRAADTVKRFLAVATKQDVDDLETKISGKEALIGAQ